MTRPVVQDAVERVEYLSHGPITFCILWLRRGFPVTGQSICPQGCPFDEEKGRQLAFRNAKSQALLLERYHAHARGHSHE